MDQQPEQPDNLERNCDPGECPEPQEIRAIRDTLARVYEVTDAGELESISVYGQMRDGSYRLWQTCCPNRHEDAGRMIEFLMLRLGFAQTDDVQQMIEDADDASSITPCVNTSA